MDTTPQALWQAKDAAVTLRNAYLTLYRERLLKWCGNKFRADWKTTSQLENYAGAYIAFMLPQMVMDNPVCDVTPRADPRDTAASEGVATLVNYWIDCSGYKQRVLEPCATNMLLGWAVTYKGIDLTRPEAARGLPIFCEPIPIGDHFVDAGCFGYAKRRFEGHCFEKTKAQLLADPRYQQSAAVIAGLTPNGQTRRREDQPVQQADNLDATSDTVTLWQFYLRESQQIVTLAEAGGGAAELRRETYDGPESGPYTLWGCYEVPGQIYPLSPLASVEEQSDDLQIHANAGSKSAQHKRVGVFNKANTEDGKEFLKAKSGDFIGMSDAASVKDVEVGGMSETQYRVLEMLRQRMDANLGFSAAQRGIATGKATLGENQLAQNNSDSKTAYIAGRLKACCEEDLRSVAWFFFNSQDVIANLAIENAQTGQTEPVQYFGGNFQQEEIETLIAQGLVDPAAIYSVGKEWGDYHLKIQVESMQRVADPIRQKRAQDEIVIAQKMGQMIAAAYGPQAALAGINWRRLVRRLGQAFNEPKYDQIMFTDAFSQMAAPDPLATAMMPPMGPPMQGQQPTPPGFGPQQPQPGLPPAGPSNGPPRGLAPGQGMATGRGIQQQAMAGVGA